MKIELDDFLYHFSLQGGAGGLFSIRCRFDARPDPGDGFEDAKAAMRGLVQTHTDTLDRLFERVGAVEKLPILVDSPHSTDLGYRYRGRLPAGRRAAARTRSRLAELFGAGAADARGELDSHIDARVEYAARKAGAGFDRVSVTTKFEMGHAINVCFFRFAQGLAGVEASKDAAEAMAGLERTLALDRDSDHFLALR